MSTRSLPALASRLIAGLVIVGTIGATVALRRSDSGVDVRVVRDAGVPLRAHVGVAKPGRTEVIATHRADGQGRIRFALDPGSYVLLPRARNGLRARQLRVRVRRGRFTPTTVRYRRRAG